MIDRVRLTNKDTLDRNPKPPSIVVDPDVLWTLHSIGVDAQDDFPVNIDDLISFQYRLQPDADRYRDML